ncbi:RING-H2 finger protein ATL2-like [Mangifera indica]|uniref:RING-H2 finger protein ATL2-like n=1 Tax=Mangifera indica TaxID=29780 RepID=UPI001CF9E9F6|nr:RING-H2 finger protein ATL2-like [Mangifera indica]
MNNDFSDHPNLPESDKSYALSGEIMLSGIVILFFVVILMVCLHLYSRCYLHNARRRQIRRNRYRRRTNLVFYVDPANSNPIVNAARGLDAAVLESLPVFVYTSNTHSESLDCAVCLCEFEENESGRVLPRCNHSFHTECIDMWFHSHSTCPLCRSPVEPCTTEPENPIHAVVSVTEPGSSSGLCEACQHEYELMGTSSFEDKGKPREVVNVSIEVPTRNYNEGFETESTGCDSLSSQSQSQIQSSFRSPVSRMLSFKRILSRERSRNLSPSGNSPSCGGTVTEFDIERGRE